MLWENVSPASNIAAFLGILNCTGVTKSEGFGHPAQLPSDIDTYIRWLLEGGIIPIIPNRSQQPLGKTLLKVKVLVGYM